MRIRAYWVQAKSKLRIGTLRFPENLKDSRRLLWTFLFPTIQRRLLLSYLTQAESHLLLETRSMACRKVVPSNGRFLGEKARRSGQQLEAISSGSWSHWRSCQKLRYRRPAYGCVKRLKLLVGRSRRNCIFSPSVKEGSYFRFTSAQHRLYMGILVRSRYLSFSF